MKLNYKILGEENQEPLFILHGLFGSSDNWHTLGKHFAETYKVYLVDQRNHGESPHSDIFNYEVMVEDFNELVTDLGYNKINLIGHSMGGKTAIGFAASHPEKLNKMVVVDISHKQYPLHHQQILAGLTSIDLNQIKSRSQADKQLSQYIDNLAIRQFLLKNLYWNKSNGDKKLAWHINLPVLNREIGQIVTEIPFDTIDVNTLFIRGALSNYILESDYDEIKRKFPNSQIVTIQDAGHWVHAEKRDEFFDLIMDFLAH